MFDPVEGATDGTPAAGRKARKKPAARRPAAKFAPDDGSALFLGWDTGTLTRYLNGTWRMPPARAARLEAFLAASEIDLASIHCLPRRQHRSGNKRPLKNARP